MPIIEVTGIPASTLRLQDLRQQIKQVVAGRKSLGLTEDQVTVRFPPDLLEANVIEVIVEVKYLFDTPDRTPIERQGMADDLKNAVIAFAKKRMPGCRLIEVMLAPPYNPLTGFARVEL
jgi:hypothetical protein